MRISVGVDIAKEVHWATAMDDAGEIRLDRRVANRPEALAAVIEELRQLGGELTVGVDVVGGIATLATVMLVEAGFRVVHVSGLAVNRARQGQVGGERKSDPRDARVIAEQVRSRRDLRPLQQLSQLDAEIRLLVGRRRDLVEEQTRRLARLHDLLVAVHPGLEQALDLTTKGPLWLLTRYVTPRELRAAGRARVTTFLRRGHGLPQVDQLARVALEAADAQRTAVPGEHLAADLTRELAQEALAVRQRIAQVDRQLEERLPRHPDAALIRSLPGMGAVLTAEFIAEAGDLTRYRSPQALAAAAGLAPVLRQSGKVRYLRRAHGGNKGLKWVLYQSAFCSLPTPASHAFYARKRREGKRHHQAVIALARRRVDVLWAMLRDREPFRPMLALAS